jgi:hypothetical protein
MAQHLYTYGVIKQDDLELEVDGVDGADRIYTVDYRTLSAVVSDIDTTDPDRTDQNVQAHNAVLQEVLQYDGGRSVVPMSFGMAFKNARTLKGVMRGARRALRSGLQDIDGTVELGVKVIGPEEHPVPEEVQVSIADRLSAVSIGETDNDLFSDRLVLNKSYLVEREQRAAFDEAIDAIEEAHGETLRVQYTGPWAPYNFVDIHIGAGQQSER